MEKPCVYKLSCGYDFCQGDACPEYKAKKRGEPFYGTTEEEIAHAAACYRDFERECYEREATND